MLSTTLRDGTTVLAKQYKGETCAVTYANRTQASNAAQKHGGEVIQRGRPFFVRLKPDSTIIWRGRDPEESP
jgi:hypothetical protein